MNTKEIVRDVVGVAGLTSIAVGVYLNFGMGWGLIAFGVSTVALAAAAR